MYKFICWRDAGAIFLQDSAGPRQSVCDLPMTQRGPAEEADPREGSLCQNNQMLRLTGIDLLSIARVCPLPPLGEDISDLKHVGRDGDGKQTRWTKWLQKKTCRLLFIVWK
jgi:hypothetical protein